MSKAVLDPVLEQKVKDCIVIASAELLHCYINNDENVILIGDAFKIPVKLSVINCFLPVMKKALENTWTSKSEESNEKLEKSIQLGDFDLDTVALFVKIVQYGTTDVNIEWEPLIKLLKFAHFYQSSLLLNLCYDLGKSLITFDNFHEGISLMELHDFDAWYDKCLEIIMAGNNRRTLLVCDRFLTCLKSCPKATAQILHKLAKSLIGIQ